MDAESSEDAVTKSLAMFDLNKRALIDLKNADEGAAFDWQPSAEPQVPRSRSEEERNQYIIRRAGLATARLRQSKTKSEKEQASR